MDSYFISENEEQTVPKFQEALEMVWVDKRSSPPDAWLDWGSTLNEKFGTSNITCAKPAKQDRFDKQIPYTEYCYGVSECPNNSNMPGGNSSINYGVEKSLHLDEQLDYQLQILCQSNESLSSIQQMDDIFMNSFIDEDPCDMGDSFQSICRSTQFENLQTDMLTDSHGIEKESSCMVGSKYLKVNDFPVTADQISTDWEGDLREEASLYNPRSCLTPAYSGTTDDSSMIKAPLLTGLIPTTLNTSVEANRSVGEESLEAPLLTGLITTTLNTSVEANRSVGEESLEANALQELEVVMTKLDPKTRICFRDALYRLASRSSKSVMEASSTPPVHGDRSRYVCKTSTELETNAIDRAIANLMFNKLDNAAPDFSCASSIHDKGDFATIEPHEYCLNQPQMVPSLLPVSLSCDEVNFPFSDRETETTLPSYMDFQEQKQ